MVKDQIQIKKADNHIGFFYLETLNIVGLI